MSSIGGIGGAGGAGGIQQIIAMRQQIIDRSALLQQVRQPQPGAEAAAASDPSSGFAGALKSALDGVSDSQSKAEALTNGYQKGEVTDVAKVMLARQEAGIAFEATLQVRNRLLSAYQDIMRMGV
jgi:flagellar hook-basal body complex protein FliE